jgi:ubiquinone/menaquinone biosynthesis C-methylase UbiE
MHHDPFSEEEFDTWSKVGELDTQERRLFDRYLLHLPKTTRILDIGTGGGRFLYVLHQAGFRCLSGIDSSARMVEAAQTRFSSLAPNDPVRLSVQRASQMTFEDESQDVVIALQQVGSFIEDPAERIRSFHEFFRVLAPGGLLVASFLSWKSRWYNPLLAAAIAPVKILKGDLKQRQKQYLCWLKLGATLNFAYLWTGSPMRTGSRRKKSSNWCARPALRSSRCKQIRPREPGFTSRRESWRKRRSACCHAS